MKICIAIVGGLCAASSADIVERTFPITPEQEVGTPDVTGFDPSGVGFIRLDTDTNLLEWEVNYEGLTGDLNAAHFHGPADFGQNAGVQVGISTGGPSAGQIVGSATITDAQEFDLLAGLWYVNLHTTQNAPGEIRGQVVPVPGVGLLAMPLALAARRRR